MACAQPPLTADEWQLIAGWLAAADIDYIEVTTPAGQLRMARGDAGYSFARAGGVQTRTVQAVAACPGVFRDRHPVHSPTLARPGQRVEEGDVIGLLQIGQLLVPVFAPLGGLVVGALLAPGTLVGYGTPLIEIDAGEP